MQPIPASQTGRRARRTMSPRPNPSTGVVLAPRRWHTEDVAVHRPAATASSIALSIYLRPLNSRQARAFTPGAGERPHGGPPPPGSGSENDAHGEPRRAATLDQSGDLVPVDAIRVRLGQRSGDAETLELGRAPFVHGLRVMIDGFAGSCRGWFHRLFLQAGAGIHGTEGRSRSQISGAGRPGAARSSRPRAAAP